MAWLVSRDPELVAVLIIHAAGIERGDAALAANLALGCPRARGLVVAPELLHANKTIDKILREETRLRAEPGLEPEPGPGPGPDTPAWQTTQGHRAKVGGRAVGLQSWG